MLILRIFLKRNKGPQNAYLNRGSREKKSPLVLCPESVNGVVFSMTPTPQYKINELTHLYKCELVVYERRLCAPDAYVRKNVCV